MFMDFHRFLWFAMDSKRFRGRLNVSKKTTTAGTFKHPTPSQNKNDDDASSQTLGEGRGGVTGVM